MSKDDFDADLDDDESTVSLQKGEVSGVDAGEDDGAEIEDGADLPVQSKRRFILPVFLALAAVAAVLLTLGNWASISYGFLGAFAGNTFHLYVNGFGALSTDLPGAEAAVINGPSLIGWLMCGCAAVLFIAAVARALRPQLQRFLVMSIAAAIAQIALAIYQASVVHSHAGKFYSQLDLNAKLMQAPATFSVGWAVWVELLLGFVILAVAVVALVKDHNRGIPLIRL